ncbi:MAG TPA: hypothetical protein VN248_06360 [Arenimonas sp.]|nr:hypothetical protein [Arenimonas sp.]
MDIAPGENSDAVSALVTEAGEAAPQTVDALNENGSKRRRGRRGGRRRRRQEGDGPENAENASLSGNDQSELDFDDADDQDDIVITLGEAETTESADLFAAENESKPSEKPVAREPREPREPRAPRAATRPSPVVVSAIPVTFAESDFSDLGDTEEPEPAADSVVEPAVVPAEPVIPATAPVAAAVVPVEQVIATEEPDAELPDVTVEPEKQVAAALTATPDFIEPKPQQTGYVPVAPPSFSMPNAPSNGFDFTVRISPENRAD